MDTFLVFFATLLFIFILGYTRKLPLFVTLLLGGLFFGLLAGAGPDATLQWLASGLGTMFGAFAIAILSGIVIVRLLSDQGLIEVMAAGIHAKIKNTRASSGILSFILAVPITCPVVTYAMLSPALEKIEPDRERSKVLLYVAAVSGIVSYILIFPTPVTQPLVAAFAPQVFGGSLDLVTIPLALCLLCVVIAAAGRWITGSPALPGSPGAEPVPRTEHAPIPLSLHLRAWAPFMAILAAIPVGHFVLGLSHAAILQFIMLTGLVVALVLAPPKIRFGGFSGGITTAGMVVFDICAAGAIGTVMVKSGLAKSALATLIPILPDILIPFIIAVILATAQGSRIVTAVVSAQVLGATALVQEINPLPMILMVVAGTCIFCHVTDPFFHLVKKTTGDDTPTVLRNYTIPLACIGIIIFIVALSLVAVFFPYHEDAALSLMGV
ncbi:GntP family permease [Methanoregula sp. UBA64]|jgi:gluconate:H+ symporter, GntP family|uniref:GntT/GntP/DsdX family permease n=1 Tax=Methanoregula sp. UBA64 TaxID=1915554 RepID=UPI0025E682DC|nr:GntP family permease [Methanoregula sp. UBA64]